MSEEFGEWIEHDGRGCPPAGQLTEVIAANGRCEIGVPSIDSEAPPPGTASMWVWASIPDGHPWWAHRIIRYRIRKPKALEQLRQIARDVETPLVNTPKEPVRA